jgi:general L-amino acid transport system substrate-binding protein
MCSRTARGGRLRVKAGVKSAKEMDGATICAEPGTSTELLVNDYFRLSNIKFTPILIADLPEVQGASCPAVRVKVVAA